VRLNARTAFVVLLLAVFGAKVWLAWRLPLFGDEAFYWFESRMTMLAGTDVPGLTPWLIALGTRVAGNIALGVRWPFLLISLAIPFLVVAWSRRFAGDGEARHAGALSLLLPLAASLGVLALPDVPMTALTLLLALALDDALRSNRWRDHLLLGVVISLGWLSHYRFAMCVLVGVAFVFAMPRGRALLREKRFWVGQVVGLAGLVPTLIFNMRHDWVGFRFQFIDRHPWQFHADALRDPFVQLVVTTPLLFVALIAAMGLAWRRRRDVAEPNDILAVCGGGMLVAWFVLGLFADSERLRVHWALPAYLLALPLVPQVLRHWREREGRLAWLTRTASMLTPVLALAGTIALGIVLLANAAPAPRGLPAFGRPMPENLQGWHEFGDWARALARHHRESILIADNFMPAAELAFALRARRPVYVLDHARNRKHGRQGQLAVMARDEQALAATGWREGLLFVEETALTFGERAAQARALCERFATMRVLDELVLFGGHSRFVAYTVTPSREPGKANRCALPSFAYIDAPLPGARVVAGEALPVRGWAFQDRVGVEAVEVLIDGEAQGRAVYGVSMPGIGATSPAFADPHQPRTGFTATIAGARLAPGRHELALRVIGSDGRQRDLAQQVLHVDAKR
jgi:hypothetical protein